MKGAPVAGVTVILIVTASFPRRLITLFAAALRLIEKVALPARGGFRAAADADQRLALAAERRGLGEDVDLDRRAGAGERERAADGVAALSGGDLNPARGRTGRRLGCRGRSRGRGGLSRRGRGGCRRAAVAVAVAVARSASRWRVAVGVAVAVGGRRRRRRRGGRRRRRGRRGRAWPSRSPSRWPSPWPSPSPWRWPSPSRSPSGVGVAVPWTMTVPVMLGCAPHTNAYVPGVLKRQVEDQPSPSGDLRQRRRARRRASALEHDVVEAAAARVAERDRLAGVDRHGAAAARRVLELEVDRDDRARRGRRLAVGEGGDRGDRRHQEDQPAHRSPVFGWTAPRRRAAGPGRHASGSRRRQRERQRLACRHRCAATRWRRSSA